MERNKIISIISVLIIVTLSLIPFIWVHDGRMILGHDAGTPIEPTVHFLDRLFAWTHRYGLGTDQTFAVPGFFIHGLEYVLDRLGLSVSVAQGISFSLYMMGAGFAMYLLARKLFSHYIYLPLFAALFYMFNHFTLQAWYIAERTKFTTYIAFPIVLLIILKLVKKELGVVKASLLLAGLITVLNGGGFLPLFGSILVVTPVWAMLHLLGLQKKAETLKRLILTLGCTGVFFVLLNAYWLLPYLTYLRVSFSQTVATGGGLDGVLAWLITISQWASYSNLLHLRGIPEWYANPNHPYAQVYISNATLKIVAAMIPILAFLPLRIAKEKRMIAILVVITLVSMFFTAGSHPPFGWLYVLFIKYVPGFLAFRTAFYKFAPGVWFGYSLLIAYTLNYFLEKYLHKRIVLQIGTGVFIAFGILTYSFPFLSTRFFEYDKNRTTLVKVPEYVSQYAQDRRNGLVPYNRILILPPQPVTNTAESTKWGYWSLATTSSLFDTGSYVDRSVYLTQGERVLVDELYRLLEKGQESWMDLAKRLGINAILLREDIVPYLSDGQQIDAHYYKQILNSFGIVAGPKYGAWTVYPLTDGAPKSDVTQHTSYIMVNDYRKDSLFPSFGFDYSKIIDSSVLILDQPILGAEKYQKAEVIIPDCVRCGFPDPSIFNENISPVVFPGSMFYKQKILIEKLTRKTFPQKRDQIEYLTRITLRRLFEMKRAADFTRSKEERIVGWIRYREAITKLNEQIHEYLRTTPDNEERNSFLLQISDNLSIQVKQLNGVSSIITDAVEGQPFIDVYQAVRDVVDDISNSVFQSTTPEEKKYILPVTTSGRYEVWLDAESVGLDTTDGKEATIGFTIDGRQSSVGITGSGWVPFTQVSLGKGTHKLQLSIPSPNYVNPSLILQNNLITSLDNQKYVLHHSAGNECVNIELGVLPKDKYKVSFNLRSQYFKTKASIFVQADRRQTVLLPNLTETLSLVDSGSARYRDYFISNGRSPNTIMICQLFADEQDEVELNNLEVLRVTVPRLALVRENSAFIQVPDAKIQTTKKDNTNYEIDLAPHEGVLLELNQRYDPSWNVNGYQETHRKANLYSQMWFIPPNASNEDLHIEFTAQKWLRRGALVTIGAVGSLGILFLFISRRKK